MAPEFITVTIHIQGKPIAQAALIPMAHLSTDITSAVTFVNASAMLAGKPTKPTVSIFHGGTLIRGMMPAACSATV